MRTRLLSPLVAIALIAAALTIALWLPGRRSERLSLPQTAALSPESKERLRRLWETYLAAESARRAGDHKRAIELYDAVLRADPRHEDALYALGNIYLERDRFDPALRAFEQLRAVNPQSARAHYQLAVLRSTVEPAAPLDLDAAQAELNQALALNPEESGPFLRLARLHAQMGRWADARTDAALALRRNPKSHEASHLLALIALAENNIAEAASQFAHAIVLYRGDKPLGGVLGEGDTAATLNAFDLEDAHIVRDLFAVNAIATAAGSLPENVPDWVRWKGGFPMRPSDGFAATSIPAEAGRGVWIDADANGSLDLVLARTPLAVMYNDGHGNLRAPQPIVSNYSEDDRQPAFDLIAADVNGDGRQDLFVVGAGWTGHASDHLLLARPRGGFDDVTEQWGLGGARPTATAVFADLDGDGRPDIVLGLSQAVDGRSVQIWLNRGSKFVPVDPAQLPEITTAVVGVAAADVDRTPGAEIFLSLWREPGRLLRRTANGSFADITDAAGVRCTPGLTATFFDFDRDGKLDLFCPGYPGNEVALRARFRAETRADAPGARLFRQVEPGKFQEAAGVLPTLHAGVMQVGVGDFNGDGWPDLYLACGGFGLDDFEPDVLLISRVGTKFEEALPLGALDLPRKSVGVAVADINGDGMADAYVAHTGVLPGDKRAGQILLARTPKR